MEAPEEVSLVQSHQLLRTNSPHSFQYSCSPSTEAFCQSSIQSLINDSERVTTSLLIYFFFFLTTSISQSDGDTNTECSALRAVARPTPPQPYVPARATAAQLQIAGPGVPTQQHPVCPRHRRGRFWTGVSSKVRLGEGV